MITGLQWMEMIWSVLKQMRFALRGFAVTISILPWFGVSTMIFACSLLSQYQVISALRKHDPFFSFLFLEI